MAAPGDASGHNNAAAAGQPSARDVFTERLFWANRCADCKWREVDPDSGVFCRVCNKLSAVCGVCSTPFPAGYYSHARSRAHDSSGGGQNATAHRDHAGFERVAAAFAKVSPEGNLRECDNLCRPCTIRAGVFDDAEAAGAVHYPPERFEEMTAEALPCIWCGCRAWVGTEITFHEDTGRQATCLLCADGLEPLAEEWWAHTLAGRDEILCEWFGLEKASTLLSQTNDAIALMRYQFETKDANARQGARRRNNAAGASGGAPRKYMGRRADSFPRASQLQAFGTGCWCPKYLANNLGVGVAVSSLNNERPPRAMAKKLAGLMLEKLCDGRHPVYSDPQFRRLLEYPHECAGLGLQLGPVGGGIAGITFHTLPQKLRATADEVFVPYNAAGDLDAGALQKKHEELSNLWEELIGVEFPLLFPNDVQRPAHVSFVSFLRQYFARNEVAHPALSDLHQVLLIRYALNKRQRIVLAYQKSYQMSHQGALPKRLPQNIPHSFENIAAQRAIAFAIMRRRGAYDLFTTVTHSDEWPEILREGQLRQYDGLTAMVEPCLGSRVFHARMTTFMQRRAEVYSSGAIAVWGNESQPSGGRPHRHALFQFEKPLLVAGEFDDFITRDQEEWLEECPRWKEVAGKLFVHHHTSACLRPGRLQCGAWFPAVLVLGTFSDERGFLQIQTLAGQEYAVPIDRKAFARLLTHCNAVGVGGARRVRYVIKYPIKNKTPPVARGGVSSASQVYENPEAAANELNDFHASQVLPASEAASDLYSIPRFGVSLPEGTRLKRITVDAVRLRQTCAGVWGRAAGACDYVDNWLDRSDTFAGWSFERFTLHTCTTGKREVAEVLHRYGAGPNTSTDIDANALTADAFSGWTIETKALEDLIRTKAAAMTVKEFKALEFLRDRGARPGDVLHVLPATYHDGDTFLAWLVGLHLVRRDDVREFYADPIGCQKRWQYANALGALAFQNFLEEVTAMRPGLGVLSLFAKYFANFDKMARQVAWLWIETEHHRTSLQIQEFLLAQQVAEHLVNETCPALLVAHVFANEAAERWHYIRKHLERMQSERAAHLQEYETLMTGTPGAGGLYIGQRNAVAEFLDLDCGEPTATDFVTMNEPAGAGKAFVIRAIQLWCYIHDEIVVLWGASGQAATIIQGTTIHCGAGLTIDLENAEGWPMEFRAMLGDARVIVLDEFGMANASWITAAEKKTAEETRIWNEMTGGDAKAPRLWWGGKKVLLSGDLDQLPSVLRNLQTTEMLLSTHIAARPAREYIADAPYWREISIDDGGHCPRFLDAAWSAELQRVRSGETEEIDLLDFQQVGENESWEIGEEFGYDWLREILEADGNAVAAMNRVEIVVGCHSERRRVLEMRREVLHRRHFAGHTYTPRAINLQNPLLEGFDDEDNDRGRAEPLALFKGEKVALTSSLLLLGRTYSTNSRGAVVGFGEHFVAVRFDDTNEEELVPVRQSFEEDHSGDPMARWLVVALGVRPALVSTIHSFQGRTIALGVLYVISLATIWVLHGLCYTFLSRPRQKNQIHFYRNPATTRWPNVVDRESFGMPHFPGPLRYC
eukprot:g18013.t1